MTNITLADPQTFAPFRYGKWEKTRPDAWELIHRGTLFIGEPGVALGKLVELRLLEGKWSRDPIVSGGSLTNRTEKSIFITVQDHANATEFFVDLLGLRGAERVGTPIQMEVIVGGRTQRVITLGYIGGVSTHAVPFFNPPTNDRQQTMLVLNNWENDNVVNVVAVDAGGTVFRGNLATIAPGAQVVLDSETVYKAVGAEAVEGNKLRLIICSSAPLTVVSKVRDGDTGIITDNAVVPVT
jgi:hypothetical protein